MWLYLASYRPKNLVPTHHALDLHFTGAGSLSFPFPLTRQERSTPTVTASEYSALPFRQLHLPRLTYSTSFEQLRTCAELGRSTMQVQPGYYNHGHPPQVLQSNNNHINGVHGTHSGTAPQPISYVHGPTNGASAAGDMNNPYGHHAYPPNYGYQQPQRNLPQQGQLPPMLTGMDAPPMPMVPGPLPTMSGPPNLGPHGYVSRDYGPQPLPAGYGMQRPQQPPPPGPSQPREPAALTRSFEKGPYKYTLVVEQQPSRARMCGFGDKDRRPITPPPCIRLIISDVNTGKEVDCEDFDGTFFGLQVDLWDEHAGREVNLVRASNSSPAASISNATITSFPPTPERPIMHEPGHPGVQYSPNGHQFPPQPQYGSAYPFTYGQPGYPPAPAQYAASMAPASSMMYTRNLIGSLTVNASKLLDTNGKHGFWFVLQDLSVRTEGFFRYAILPVFFLLCDLTSSLGSKCNSSRSATVPVPQPV